MKSFQRSRSLLAIGFVAAGFLLPQSQRLLRGDDAEKKGDLDGKCRKILEPLLKDAFLIRNTVWQQDASAEEELVLPVYLLRGNQYVFSVVTASGKPLPWVLRDREKILINPVAQAKEAGAGAEAKEEEAKGEEAKGEEAKGEAAPKPAGEPRYRPARSDHYFLHMKLPKGAAADRVAVTYAYQ